MKTPVPKGPFRGNVRIKTDNFTSPVVDVNVSGTVPDALTIAPAQIVLTEKPDGVTRYVVVRPGIVKAFTVHEVHPDGKRQDEPARDRAEGEQ